MLRWDHVHVVKKVVLSTVHRLIVSLVEFVVIPDLGGLDVEKWFEMMHDNCWLHLCGPLDLDIALK